VHGLILATVTSDNSPHGYNLTFAFPMLLFIIIGGALYLVFTRPHTVPGHGELRLSGQGKPERGTMDPGRTPESGTARSAATAAGLSTAAGGGTVESVHEAAGAHRAAGPDQESGNVSQDENQAAAAGPESGDPSAPGSPSAAASTPDEDEASE
jgi:hypothetical protein